MTTTAPSTTTLTSTTQKRSHSGHSHGGHGHHHHHDNTYLTSTNKSDPGVRITRIGLFVNLAMAISKGIGGYMFHSQALIADAYHALTDMVSDFMTLATVAWSVKPPSQLFPTGFGKVESLGALGVSGLLLFGGVFMGLNACELLYTQLFMDAAEAAQHAQHPWFGHGHSHAHGGHDHGHGIVTPDLNAAWLALGSIGVKEWLYRSTMKIAKERKSAVLASNAIHHRIDSLTSIVALATIGGAHVFTDATWLDPVGSLLISLMIIKAGLGNTKNSFLELIDVSVDDDMKKRVRTSASKALIGTKDGSAVGVAGGESVIIRDVQGLKSGQNYLMEIELAVPGSWSVDQISVVEDAVRERVGTKVRGVKRVKVQFTSKERENRDFMSEFIGSESRSGDPEASDDSEDDGHSHSHSHTHSHGHGNGDVNGKKKN